VIGRSLQARDLCDLGLDGVVLPQVDPTRVSAPEDWHAFISDMSGVTVRKDARIIVQYIYIYICVVRSSWFYWYFG
jgi:hypothetical protein